MLPEAARYEDLVARFRWQVPERYNIASSACDRWAEKDPERLAIRHVRDDGGTTDLTFGRMRDQAERFAAALRAHGIGPGDRVALLMPQGPEAAIAHFAIYKLGAVALPLALLFGPEALEHRLTDSGAKAVVANGLGLQKLSAIRGGLPALQTVFCTDGGSGGAIDFAQACADQAPGIGTADTSCDDPALMIYTSGTTGPAKGALHAHRVLLGHLPGVQMPHEFFPRPGDRMWTPADWAWAGGLLNILLPSLHFGVTVVAQPFQRFDTGRAYELIARHGVRNAFIPPTALRMMRAAGDVPAEVGLRTIGSGGESLGREVYDWAKQALGVTVNEFYGQTECNLVLASCAAIGVSRAGQIGKPVPGHEVAVIDGEGRVLPAGEIGQIAVRAPDPVMFLSYWNRPEATEKKFVGDWLMTGDQGAADPDGYIGFVGRDDDVITSAGYRIGPGEVEDCLLGHPAVSLAAVIGKDDPVRTQIVKAFIVLRDGHRPSDELRQEIQTFVRDRLSAHEYPREIAFIEEMPLTTTGKVIRRLLREQS